MTGPLRLLGGLVYWGACILTEAVQGFLHQKVFCCCMLTLNEHHANTTTEVLDNPYRAHKAGVFPSWTVSGCWSSQTSDAAKIVEKQLLWLDGKKYKKNSAATDSVYLSSSQSHKSNTVSSEPSFFSFNNTQMKCIKWIIDVREGEKKGSEEGKKVKQ